MAHNETKKGNKHYIKLSTISRKNNKLVSLCSRQERINLILAVPTQYSFELRKTREYVTATQTSLYQRYMVLFRSKL